MKYLKLLPLLLLIGCIGVDASTMTRMEQGYFEGQRDAMKGDWKIKKVNDSCYVWVKSPWRVGVEPSYQPDCE